MRTGFYIVGKFLGYRVTKNTNRETGEIRMRNLMGVELQNPNEYGGFNTVTQEIRIVDGAFTEGFKNLADKHKGKMVMIMVFPREWAMDGGRSGIVYTFDESSIFEEIKQ